MSLPPGLRRGNPASGSGLRARSPLPGAAPRAGGAREARHRHTEKRNRSRLGDPRRRRRLDGGRMLPAGDILVDRHRPQNCRTRAEIGRRKPEGSEAKHLDRRAAAFGSSIGRQSSPECGGWRTPGHGPKWGPRIGLERRFGGTRGSRRALGHEGDPPAAAPSAPAPSMAARSVSTAPGRIRQTAPASPAKGREAGGCTGRWRALRSGRESRRRSRRPTPAIKEGIE